MKTKISLLLLTIVGAICTGFRGFALANGVTPSGEHEDWRGGITMFVQDTSLNTQGNLLVRRDPANPDRNVLGITNVTQKPHGFAGDSVVAQGDSIDVHLLGLGSRTVPGVSAGAIAAGAELVSNGDGRVKAGPPAVGEWTVGEANSETTAANQPIQVIRCRPIQKA